VGTTPRIASQSLCSLIFILLVIKSKVFKEVTRIMDGQAVMGSAALYIPAVCTEDSTREGRPT
jgi:hypothetical protein